MTQQSQLWKFCSHKKINPIIDHLHSIILVKRLTEHKHLALIFDPKLSFLKHITEKVGIARKGIGIIKHLAPYLPVKSRDQIFKTHVRPHLDYCDMIYHIPVKTKEMSDGDSQRTLNYLMGTLALSTKLLWQSQVHGRELIGIKFIRSQMFNNTNSFSSNSNFLSYMI